MSLRVVRRPGGRPALDETVRGPLSVGLQPTDKFRGESRDPSTRCSCRLEMDPGFSPGKRSILLPSRTVLLAQRGNLVGHKPISVFQRLLDRTRL